jgi:Mg/Co/Ni transporter MgtE
MKLHIEHLKVEKEQFDKRKEKMLEEVKKDNVKTKENQASAPVSKEKPKKEKIVKKIDETVPRPIFNPKDMDDINELYEFLKDDEVEGFDPSSGKRMAVTKDGEFEEI